MKWTIRIELTPEGNEPITRDVADYRRRANVPRSD
jgi:hypothetical protein